MPRVSQYRLAAHLSSAVVLYSVLFWNAKEILAPAFRIAPEKVTPALAQLRKMVISSKALVFLTLVSGAEFLSINYVYFTTDDSILQELLWPVWTLVSCTTVSPSLQTDGSLRTFSPSPLC